MVLKTSLIHCLVDAEAAGFHPAGAATKTLAVNLGFECVTDIAATGLAGDNAAARAMRMALKTDETEARTRFERFITDAKTVEFHLFEATSDSVTTCTLIHKGKITTLLSDISAPNAARDVITWLDKAAPKDPEIRHYWTTVETIAATEASIDATTAAATWRLRAAHSWNAPVAHRLGLTHILKPGIIVDPAIHVVLPFFAEPAEPLPAIAGQLQGAQWDFTYAAGGAPGEITCRTDVLAPADFDMTPEEVSPFLTAEGYLTVDPDAEGLWRITKWFETRAASLMAPAGALAGPGAGSKSGQDNAYNSLFQWDYGSEQKPFLTAPAPAWLAATSLCASLDNIIIGIVQPVSSANTIGDILSPLMFALHEQFETTIADEFDLTTENHDPMRLASVLRATLSRYSPLMQAAPDFSVPALRRAFCKSLRHVHGIAPGRSDVPADIQILDMLLTSFSEGTGLPIDAKTWSVIKDNGPALLRRALGEAEQRLQDEAGAETAIVRLLETVGIADAEKNGPGLAQRFAEQYLEDIDPPAGGEALLAAVQLAFAEAWRAYRILLDSPFNGAEAVRRSAASVFTKAVLLFAGNNPRPDMPSSRRVIEIAGSADYYARRMLDTPIPSDPADTSRPLDCFGWICDSLISIPFPTIWPDGFTAISPAQLYPFLAASYRAALAPMTSAIEASARFVPDHSPAPMPIQIAANIDGDAIDAFARYFNGVALAIRRIDTLDVSDRWAHASLAALSWPVASKPGGGGIEPAIVPAAIHPLLPAASDGRAPMFMEYEGMPLAATTFRNTAAGAIADTPDAYMPFYVSGAPDLEASAFLPIPRLAYGRAFETFSFATTNAGSLPLALQGDLPWMPKADFDAPVKDGMPDHRLVTRALYQRRTAIGQMAVNEMPVINRSRRIGVPIDGVAPLAEDYPRTALAALPGAPGVRDLFRARDGSGTLVIPALIARPMAWQVSGTVFTGRPARLEVRLFDKAPAGPDDAGIAAVSLAFPKGFDFSAPGTIAFSIDTVQAGTPAFERHLSLACGKSTAAGIITATRDIAGGWIRLSLVSDEAASLSFAIGSDVQPYETGAPLLVLAPTDGSWKDGLRDTVTVRIDTPRIGYLDFERWFANADLRDAVFDRDAARHLQRALLTAYVLRDADEGLSRALDRLPDPAVEAIRLELAVTDRLDDSAYSPKTHVLWFGFRQTMKSVMTGLIDHGEGQWSPADLHAKLFKPIEAAFRFAIDIKPGTFDLSASDPPAASIPDGVVARLSLDALVPSRHFETSGAHPAVFHPGLKQHTPRTIIAPGSAEIFFAYPSAAIQIETMLDGMHAIDTGPGGEPEKPAIRLVADMVAVRPIANTRRYDLQTRSAIPGPDPLIRMSQWRLLGEIDVTTQRWRASGRPIYDHISPWHFLDEKALLEKRPPGAADACLPLKEVPEERSEKEGAHPLSRFEGEAFFDRADIDSQTVTQRLLPLPATTMLQQHIWDAPSATYFRHRFTLRSRYAGALKTGAVRQVKAWISSRDQRSTPAEAWTLRVAMLADLSRRLLTRPQQRALIPLTSAPRDDGKAALAPPVLAILQEPPFSRGGLADRIAAEIRTGFNYGFASAGADAVGILDSRKEIGPDPRLTYRPMGEDEALGMALNVEGPIGLTFDQVNAPAPAFPNSMILLSPLSATGKQENLEEHFLGISMRRYIDPDWTMKPAPDPSKLDLSKLDAGRCWWITPDGALTTGNLMRYAADGIDAPLLTLEAKDGFFTVAIVKAAIDGGFAEAVKLPVVIARWSDGFADRLAILHQPVGPGRYSASIFVLPKTEPGNVTLGRSNSPLLICNFEWGPPKEKRGNGEQAKGNVPAAVTLNTPGASARPAMASAPTFLSWTRSGRNFDTVHMPDFTGGEPALHAVPARDLLAKLAGTSLSFTRSGTEQACWLCSSIFLKPFPLHVQRHLAVLTTGYLREPGRPVEEYRRSALLTGRSSADLAGMAGKEDCLRIIEFETPSAILCGSPGAIPEPYRKAYFDLVSTGFSPPDSAASARLFFRFAGPLAHLQTFDSLTIRLSFTQTSDDPHSIPVNLKNVPAGHFVTAVELFIERHAADAPLTYRPVLVCSNGESIPEPAFIPDNMLGLLGVTNHNPGFFLELQAAGGGEFWVDVSILHLPSSKFDSGFAFDWLFSEAGGSEPELEVTPAGLNAMVEAQARIVSVSPPIPIQSQDI